MEHISENTMRQRKDLKDQNLKEENGATPDHINSLVEWNKHVEVAKAKLVENMSCHLKILLDKAVAEALQSYKKENATSQPHKRDRSSGSDKKKIFLHRASLLDELMEVEHFRTIYHVFVAALCVFVIGTLAVDFVDQGRLVLEFDLLFYAFGQFKIVVFSWIILFSYTLWVPYKALHFWGSSYPKSKHPFILSASVASIFIVCQICILGVLPVYIVVHYKLPPASSFIVTLEQARFLMKSYAFLREKVPSVILKERKEEQLPELSSYLYFLFCPTLIYRDSYPRTPYVRWKYVAKNFSQFLGCVLYLYFVMVTLVTPAFTNMSEQPFRTKTLVLSIFRATLPGMFVLLISFFGVLHCWQNAFAEMLRFADRMFYKDWWNSTSFSNYYRTWNVVIHDWLYYYVYRDLLWLCNQRCRGGVTLAVFLMSAVVHEYALTVSLGYFYPVMFCLFAILGGGTTNTVMADVDSTLQKDDRGDDFLKQALSILMQGAGKEGSDRNQKVCEWMEPEELRKMLDFSLRSNGESQEVLLGYCRDIIRFSVKTGHPRFFNQLFSGLDRYALTGRILTETLNTSQYTYEVAPVFVLMEEEVLRTLRHFIGWRTGDGIFCPGGSLSNMYAMNVARFHRFPYCKEKGLGALPRMVLFTSEESHYSVKKGAAFLGIGTDNVILVQTDDRGKMIPEDLQKKIEKTKSEGAVPFLVSATCGTTVLGAFDPIQDLADVCEKHGLWLHVDAAWGGSALLSRKHRHLLNGIERANSVTWNPHKMLGVGLQCSAFLLRDTTGLLERCHAANATYLFQTDKFYNLKYDTGDKSIQCGRRVDCLKLWLMWKALGSEGLERRVDGAMGHTRYLLDEMKKRKGFIVLMEPEFVNLCFWYVPPSLIGQQASPDFWERLGKVAPILKEKMMKKGSMMLGYQPHKNHVNFFRQIVVNPETTREDLDFFLDEMERLGENL